MSSTRQTLPPCCHAVRVGIKDTPKVRFKSELSMYSASRGALNDGLSRLSHSLTEARTALQLDRLGVTSSGGEVTAKFQAMDDIKQNIQAITEYASLIRGFTVAPSSLVSGAQPPVTDSLNPVATLAPNATPTASLRQPLIDDKQSCSTRDTSVDMNANRAACVSFCTWRDALTNSNAYCVNARIELAQTLLASGLRMMEDARLTVEIMLAGRVAEVNENELKIAYQLFLHAAGLFDACLQELDIQPTLQGAEVVDLSIAEPQTTKAEKSATSSDADVMEKWRRDQRLAAETHIPAPAASLPSNSATPSGDLAMLSRIPDLARGYFPQTLSWVALAEAQELVILRGLSREFIDYSLMAKLSIDTAARYKGCHAYITRHLPCSTSVVADKLRAYCSFKDAYYVAISRYFQGAACMEKDDARLCALAIANLKKASLLIKIANERRGTYDAKLAKEEKERQFLFKTVYIRSEQIIERDLDIMTRRNDSVYYERIPDPEPTAEPLSLVRAVQLPPISVHPLWRDPEVALCVRLPTAPAISAPRARAGADVVGGHVQEGSAASGGPRKEGCCSNCIIS